MALWDGGELIGYGGRAAAVCVARAYARWAELGLPGMGAFGLEIHRADAAPARSEHTATTPTAPRLAALCRPVKLMLGGMRGWADEGFPYASGEALGSVMDAGTPVSACRPNDPIPSAKSADPLHRPSPDAVRGAFGSGEGGLAGAGIA